MMRRRQVTITDTTAGTTGAVKRRGVLAGAAALIATAIASRGGNAATPTTPATSERILYDMQSPDVWYEDFGEGKLAGGKAEITVAADFVTVVDTANYHVFLTPHDPASKGLAVVARQADKFVVQELAAGTSNLTFSWRMAARPKGNKAERMPTLNIPAFKLPDVNAPPPPPPLPQPRP